MQGSYLGPEFKQTEIEERLKNVERFETLGMKNFMCVQGILQMKRQLGGCRAVWVWPTGARQPIDDGDRVALPCKKPDPVKYRSHSDLSPHLSA